MTDATPVTNTTVTVTPKPNPETPPVPKGDEGKVSFTPEQQAEIDRIAANARREGKVTGKTEAEQAIAATEAQKEADRKRQDDEAKGHYDNAKATLERERDEEKSARMTAEEKYQAAIAVLAPDVTARWKDLPTEVASMYEGADDDILAKAAHLNRTKALVDRLAGATPRTGNGPNPRRIGDEKPTFDELRQEARQSGSYAF
jgi:hypothetical protein